MKRETLLFDAVGKMSPLAQGRGLKRGLYRRPPIPPWSPLAQGRGLKPPRPPAPPILGLSPLAQGRGLKLLAGLPCG